MSNLVGAKSKHTQSFQPLMSEMEPDIDISRWVLEFLLHQSLDYTLLNSLAKSLPLPLNNYTLTKTTLLRQLRHHLSTTTTTSTTTSTTSTNSTNSATILHLLDQIQQLDYLNGFPDQSRHFKAAYFDVLGGNFMESLREKKGRSGKRGLYDEMERLWKWRVGRGALFGEVGLVAKEFLDWKEGVLGLMKGKGKGGGRGLDKVRVYVEKEMESLSPSFLEVVAGNRAVIELINGDRSKDKGDLVEVSRGDEPVVDADKGVVAVYKKNDGLPTPELKEGRLRDNIVSCEHDSEVKAKRRRQSKRWSKEEEDALRNAVVKYGKGKWKFILYAYQHIFLERTEVDLKDKWRNMSHK